MDKNEEEKSNWNEAIKTIIDKELKLGRYYSSQLQGDIKHMLFTLARYKFASKMVRFEKELEVLELGCQEGLGALCFLQNTNLKRYLGVDFDAYAINWSEENLPYKQLEFLATDFLGKKFKNTLWDYVISLDVIEHIYKKNEKEFMKTIMMNIKQEGVAIIGTPNLKMSQYASEGSRIAHVNMFDQKRLYDLCSQYFTNVFIFNMNDEVINLSFDEMACYMFALCCGKKV